MASNFPGAGWVPSQRAKALSTPAHTSRHHTFASLHTKNVLTAEEIHLATRFCPDTCSWWAAGVLWLP